MSCPHNHFDTEVNIDSLTDKGRFMAELRIWCRKCGVRFRFVGLPGGWNLNGATVSHNGQEARLAMSTPEAADKIATGGFAAFTLRNRKEAE